MTEIDSNAAAIEDRIERTETSLRVALSTLQKEVHAKHIELESTIASAVTAAADAATAAAATSSDTTTATDHGVAAAAVVASTVVALDVVDVVDEHRHEKPASQTQNRASSSSVCKVSSSPAPHRVHVA